MYAITGITGKVGGELARTLLAAGQPVRAIVRDARKGEEWAALGCELTLAEMEDTPALTHAFTGARAVFILPPSEFDPKPGYPEAKAVIDSVVGGAESCQAHEGPLPVDHRRRRRSREPALAAHDDGGSPA
jgi:NAD(P)H dehydrogenase (quinone)